jgi:hypothetical protein
VAAGAEVGRGSGDVQEPVGGVPEAGKGVPGAGAVVAGVAVAAGGGGAGDDDRWSTNGGELADADEVPPCPRLEVRACKFLGAAEAGKVSSETSAGGTRADEVREPVVAGSVLIPGAAASDAAVGTSRW